MNCSFFRDVLYKKLKVLVMKCVINGYIRGVINIEKLGHLFIFFLVRICINTFSKDSSYLGVEVIAG